MAIALHVAPDALANFAAALFEAAGLRRDDAAVIGRDLVAADLRGLGSHGVSRIPMYLERLRRGLVVPRPEIVVTPVMPAASLVDGGDGMGFLAAHAAMAEAIRLAGTSGVGLVGVRRSTHFGMSALYVQQALDAGCLSLVWTNSSPALPVWGGRSAFLGAAPFAAGLPSGDGPDYLLDMAMTVIARGKIRLAAKAGEPIPPGLALDADGVPTTDAARAFEGICLPFGGYKGAALAMLMDLMCGVFTGANFGGAVKSLYFDHSEPQNVGHLMVAMRADLFLPETEFRARMDEFSARAKACPRAHGCDEILIPGEPEERTAARLATTGVPLTATERDELVAEAKRLGVEAALLGG